MHDQHPRSSKPLLIPAASLLVVALACSDPAPREHAEPEPALQRRAIATFVGRVDQGRLTITEVQSRLSPVTVDTDADPSTGAPDTVSLFTSGSSMGNGVAEGCERENSFCADIGMWSHFDDEELRGAAIVITDLSSVDNLPFGDNDAFGWLSEFDEALGLWSYGNLSPDESATRTWHFSTPDSDNFQFSGMVVAEIVPIGEPTEDCTNGMDDGDPDVLSDCADPDCSESFNCNPEVCANGFDDDGDLDTDCEDDECSGDELVCTPQGGIEGPVFFTLSGFGLAAIFEGSVQPFVGDDNMWGFALSPSSEYGYWTDSVDGAIRRTTDPGAPPEELVTGLTGLSYIEIHPGTGDLYYIAGGNLNRATALGTDPEVVVEDVNRNTLALAPVAGRVYYARGDAVFSAALDGTDETVLVDELGGDPGDIYVLEDAAIFLLADKAGAQIVFGPLDGTDTQTLVADVPDIEGIELDLNASFMFLGGPSLSFVDLNGEPPYLPTVILSEEDWTVYQIVVPPIL